MYTSMLNFYTEIHHTLSRAHMHGTHYRARHCCLFADSIIFSYTDNMMAYNMPDYLTGKACICAGLNSSCHFSTTAVLPTYASISSCSWCIATGVGKQYISLVPLLYCFQPHIAGLMAVTVIGVIIMTFTVCVFKTKKQAGSDGQRMNVEMQECEAYDTIRYSSRSKVKTIDYPVNNQVDPIYDICY